MHTQNYRFQNTSPNPQLYYPLDSPPSPRLFSLANRQIHHGLQLPDHHRQRILRAFQQRFTIAAGSAASSSSKNHSFGRESNKYPSDTTFTSPIVAICGVEGMVFHYQEIGSLTDGNGNDATSCSPNRSGSTATWCENYLSDLTVWVEDCLCAFLRHI